MELMNTIRTSFVLAAFLLGLRLSTAQEPILRGSASVDIAEGLAGAFAIVSGDVTGDGKPDLVIGGTGTLVLVVARPESKFEPGKRLPVPANCDIRNLALADFDTDGSLDLAAYCPNAGTLLIFRGEGNGAFQPPARLAIPESQNAWGMTAADLNQDGLIDLAVGQSGSVGVLLGNGDATFRTGEQLPIRRGSEPARPVAIVSADFNGDGVPDLATVNLVYNDDGSIFLGSGAGKFQPEVRIAVYGRPHDLKAVDFNQDGRVDLAIACNSGLVLLAGTGDGSFGAGPRVAEEYSALSVASADLNADGAPDFVLGNYYDGRISVLLNQEGAFRAASPVWTLGDIFSVALPDINGDGIPDLVAASRSSDSALFATGLGDGEFEPPTYLGTYPANSFSLRTADLDSDGRADLAIVSQGRRSISLLRGGSEIGSVLWANDYPVDARFGDFDGDGIQDLLVASVRQWRDTPGNDRHATIHALKGLGNGLFELITSTEVERCPVAQGVYYSDLGQLLALATGDFTGDGVLDAILVNEPLAALQIYAGSGNGTFKLVSEESELSGVQVVSADFDGDGITDLAVAHRGPSFSSEMTLYLGSSDGRLKKGGTYPVCAATFGFQSIVTADFNGDGKPDLAVNCYSAISVLVNTEGGRFEPSPGIPAAPENRFGPQMAAVDFDGDGKDDLVLLTSTGPMGGDLLLLLLPSASNGAFRAPLSVGVPAGIISITAANFHGSGHPELAVMNAFDGTLKILSINDSQIR